MQREIKFWFDGNRWAAAIDTKGLDIKKYKVRTINLDIPDDATCVCMLRKIERKNGELSIKCTLPMSDVGQALNNKTWKRMIEGYHVDPSKYCITRRHIATKKDRKEFTKTSNFDGVRIEILHVKLIDRCKENTTWRENNGR